VYKILLSEPIDEAGLRVLDGRAQVVVSPDPSEESVGRLIQDVDALIVRTATRVSRKMLEGAGRLKVISRTGGGLNNVDIEAATHFNVVVCGVKGPQDRFVAEHTVFMMGALAKQIFYLDKETRKGNFKSRFDYRPVGLAGKRVGLIGLGRIGRIMAEICTRGFNMEVWAYDPYIAPEAPVETDIVIAKDIAEVIRTADFLSLHVPLTEETEGLMGRIQFELMKPTAFIINTSRGEVIQEKALIDALNRGTIAGAGLDVFEREPPDVHNPLFRMHNVIVTPHSAALTKETVAKLAEAAAENAICILEGRRPSYSPNWETLQAKIGQK
jgi:D-3-phosphoglycerate dehydrogenase